MHALHSHVRGVDMEYGTSVSATTRREFVHEKGGFAVDAAKDAALPAGFLRDSRAAWRNAGGGRPRLEPEKGMP